MELWDSYSQCIFNDELVVLSQLKADEKNNEITVKPQLIDLLGLKGKIVAIDAISTRRMLLKSSGVLKAMTCVWLKEIKERYAVQ